MKLQTKTALAFAMTLGTSMPTASFSGDYLSADQREAVFCGKTFDGQNTQSGWTFKVYSHDSCDKISIRYLTGDWAGKTFERRVTRYPSGENCVRFEDGKDRCTKMKDAGNGTYHQYATNGKFNGQHVGTVTNIVEGNKLD